MFDFVVEVIGRAWWSYPIIMVVAAFDVIFPLLPSETVVITAGIAAGQGRMILPLVLILAMVGAFGGDNLAYWIGNRWRGLAHRWILRGDKGKRSLDWAHRHLRRHGGSLIIIGRFVPGGRTATAVGSGVLEFPWPRFVAYDAAGAVTWSMVVTMTGYLGGATFRNQTVLAFVVAFGIALVVAGAIEGTRWVARRLGRHGRRAGP